MMGLRTYAACHDVAVSNIELFVAGSAFLGLVGILVAVAMLIERHRQDRRFAEMRAMAAEALDNAETLNDDRERAARMVHA